MGAIGEIAPKFSYQVFGQATGRTNRPTRDWAEQEVGGLMDRYCGRSAREEEAQPLIEIEEERKQERYINAF